MILELEARLLLLAQHRLFLLLAAETSLDLRLRRARRGDPIPPNTKIDVTQYEEPVSRNQRLFNAKADLGVHISLS